MAKEITQKVKDWNEVHELFVKMRDVRGQESLDVIKNYHTKARNYETKYGEVCNPLLRPS